MTSLAKSPSDAVKSFWEDLFPLDQFFERKFPNWRPTFSVPAANVRETDEAFVIELAAPGKTREDFEVEIENNEIRIASESTEEHVEEEENYARREYNFNSFSRSFRLPENVRREAVKATYQNGVLAIELPKIEVGKSNNGRKIEIQ